MRPPVTLPPLGDPVEELAGLHLELSRRRYRSDPILWAEQRLQDTLWSKQQEIFRAVAEHRRTLVQSCHEIGKSYIAALIASWWLDVHKAGDAFVVTSAPTAQQVKAILWREIGRAHVRGRLPGRVNQTEWYLPVSGKKEELVAFGRKPDEYDPAAFQGIHARRVLVIFDEGNGVRGPLWEAADSLIANDYSKILTIGNPDDPTGEFFEHSKPGSGWHVIQISAFDSPNFTGETMPPKVLEQLIGRVYVEEKRRKWAPTWRWSEDGTKVEPPPGSQPHDTNPFWQSKVLGVFPEQQEENTLIPLSWIRAAQERTLEPSSPVELGTDVGGGSDSSTIALRRGPVVRILREDHNPDTMQTCGNVISTLKETNSIQAKVDDIGIGRGVVDRAKELKEPVVGINVGSAARDTEAFVNLRAELWWAVRDRFEKGEIDIDPADDDLAGELCSLRYKRTSSGKIQIESKDEAKRRGIPSPNRADALMLALAPPKRVASAVW